MIIPLLQSQVHLTYCSNLHPIEEFSEVIDVAESFWPRLANRLQAEFDLTTSAVDWGVWLSRKSSRTLMQEPSSLAKLRRVLEQSSGQVLTANAFPMGDFHQERVKENVYLPDWQDAARLAYSQDVACLLSQLPHQGEYQSMSTSPGSFKTFDEVNTQAMAKNFVAMAQFLGRLEQDTGRRIVLAIEPEPGCTFELTEELLSFFENELIAPNQRSEALIRRHIGMCYDCCHQAIQFEDPATAIGRIRAVGMQIAKVQLSSALEIQNPRDNDEALATLGSFAEDRYLHQVVAQTKGGEVAYFGDLPDYLAVAQERNDHAARVHFHVPIFLDQIGSLSTTQSELRRSLAEILAHDASQHLEIETYSWGVMPERRSSSANQDELLEDVLAEYRWVYAQITS